jgi:hypothetical protein
MFEIGPDATGSSTSDTTINVDARGSNDPKAVEEAAARGVKKALVESVKRTVQDMSTPVK